LLKAAVAMLNPSLSSYTATRDHLIPKSKGGKRKIPDCYECNNLKGAMDPYEFRELHRPLVNIEALREKLGGEGGHFHHIYHWHNRDYPSGPQRWVTP
jgi:hypothetical protein